MSLNYNNKPIRLIELFAGIGAQAKALENLQIDFERWGVCEFDEAAICSYNAVHGTNFSTSDVTKLCAKDLNIVDTDAYTYVLTYSFPCQDLSSAGAGRGMEKGSGTRSGLLWEVERLLNDCRELPQVLLMENVPQVHSKKSLPTFNKWIAFLESKGYSNYWKDLNSKDYGVPQSRNRCFMVSVLGGHPYKWPEPVPLKKTTKDLLEDRVDPCYYFTGEHGTGGAPLKREACAKALDMTEPFEVIDPSYSNARLREIAEGWIKTKNRSDLRAICTLTTSAENFAIHTPAHEFRGLTPRECWRFMGFTDEDFEKARAVSSKKCLYQQAGNSIVVDVLMAIFKSLLNPQQTPAHAAVVDAEDDDSWML